MDRRPRRRSLRHRFLPPPSHKRLLRRKKEESGLDLADLAKYGGAQ